MEDFNLNEDIEMVKNIEEPMDPSSYELWRQGISNVIVGIILNFFTLNFLGLNIILPIVGLILIYMGISRLRSYNKDFDEVYRWGMYFLITKSFSMVMGASALNVGYGGILLGIAIMLINVNFIIKLRTAINNVYLEKGVQKKRDPFLQLILFYIVVLIGTLTVFALLPVLVILVFIWSIVIIVDLVKYKNETIELKVVIEDGPEDGKLLKQVGLTTFLLLVLTIGTMVISMHDFSAGDVRQAAPITNTETRDRLLADGVSPWLVDMLSNSELNEIEGYTDFSRFDHIQLATGESMTTSSYSPEIEVTDENLSSPYVQTFYFAKPDGTITFLQGMNWKEKAPLWKSAIATGLNPERGYVLNDDRKYILSSKLMYEKDGEEYEKSLNNILKDSEHILINSVMGIDSSVDYVSEFNFPFGTENGRIYSFGKFMNESTNGELGSVDFRYLKNDSFLKYPYQSAKVQIENAGMGNSNLIYFYSYYAPDSMVELPVAP